MKSQEFIECHKIFNDNSSWNFFKKDQTAQKLKCLEIYREKGRAQDISIFFASLKDASEILRNSAAETIRVLLEKPDSQIAFYTTLRYLDFKQSDFPYYKNTFSSDYYLPILIAASLNSNGYVREKAVRELAEIKRPEAIKFILFRLGDWVENVRRAAQKAIYEYFQPEFTEEFLRQIPLIEWLLAVERVNLVEVHSDIFRFLFSFDSDESFYQTLNRLGEKAKFIYFRNYLASKPLTKKAFQLLSTDNLFLIKIELLKHIENFDEETQKSSIRRFLKDRSSKVRVYALYSIRKAFRAEFYDELIDAAFDVSAHVREVARFMLLDFSVDYADLYRRRLQEDENSIGAILGLSEVGILQDLPFFEKYIQNPNAKIRTAVLSAIARVNKPLAANYALDLLADSSAKVRNKCVEILAPLANPEILEKARIIFRHSDCARKKTILKLFSKIGGWKIVGDFIIALGDADENIRQIAWLNLQKWRNIQRYTSPSPEDKARIMRLYNEFDRTKLESDNFSERWWSELPFYLR